MPATALRPCPPREFSGLFWGFFGVSGLWAVFGLQTALKKRGLPPVSGSWWLIFGSLLAQFWAHFGLILGPPFRVQGLFSRLRKKLGLGRPPLPPPPLFSLFPTPPGLPPRQEKKEKEGFPEVGFLKVPKNRPDVPIGFLGLPLRDGTRAPQTGVRAPGVAGIKKNPPEK